MPTSSGRKAYTEEDDDLLIRYLATVNPSGGGRSGNNLYIDFCRDLVKWPGTVTHPWQSWRDRYYRNRDYFDDVIKKYIKKHPTAEKRKHADTPKTKGKSTGSKDELAVQDPKKRKLSDYADAPRPKQPRHNTDTETSISPKQPSPLPDSEHLPHDPQSHDGPTSSARGVALAAKVDPALTSPPLSTSADPAPKTATPNLPCNPGHIDTPGPNNPDSELCTIPSKSVDSRPRANIRADGKKDVSSPRLSTPGSPVELPRAPPEADDLQCLGHASNGRKSEGAGVSSPLVDRPATDPEPQAVSEYMGVAGANDRHTSQLPRVGSIPPVRQERDLSLPAQPPKPATLKPSSTVLPCMPAQASKPKKHPTKPKQSGNEEEDPFTSASCTPLLLPRHSPRNSPTLLTKSTSGSSRQAPAIVAPLAIRRRRSPPRLLDGAYGSRFSDAPVAGITSETESDSEPKTNQWPPVRARQGRGSGSGGRMGAEQRRAQVIVKVKEEPEAPTIPTEIGIQKAMDGRNGTGPHPFFFPTPHRVMTRAAEQRQGGRPKVAIVPLSFSGGPRNKGRNAVITSSGKGKQRADDEADLRTTRRREDSGRDEDKGDGTGPFDKALSDGNPFFVGNPGTDRAGSGSSGGRSKSGPRHIDLRMLHQRSGFSVSRSNSLISTPSSWHGLPPLIALARGGSIQEGTPPVIPESEYSIITSLGMAHAIQLLVQTHGFSEEVTWNVWRETGSIVETDAVLAHMKGVAEEDGIREISARRSSVREANETEEDDEASQSPPRRPWTASLQVKLPQEDDDRMSEYSPPHTSRAGQFARLLRQGRGEEALERVERRTSSRGRVLMAKIQQENSVVPNMSVWLTAKPRMEQELKTREAELDVDLLAQWTVGQVKRFC
ncbi:hypothetical protein BD779DRAFT_1543898 [Infundibulicybe gibba]|nr:hypothetical protein BD779DRAFT_1543898 [Infundibulicybe gibba]